jgi:hypothetical protein
MLRGHHPLLTARTESGFVGVPRDRCVLCIPGILSDADNNFAWHAAAARKVRPMSGGRFDGDAFDYELELIKGIPIRWMPKMGRKVSELVKVLNEFAGTELHVIVHSNGGNMITEALKEVFSAEEPPRFHITSLHLIAPSCESDCRKNALNDAVLFDVVDQVFLYQPGRDVPVKIGHTMRFFFGWMGMGHGDLSVAGFREVDESIAHHFHTIKGDQHNHTSWLNNNHLDATLKLVLSNCDAAAGNAPLETAVR